MTLDTFNAFSALSAPHEGHAWYLSPQLGQNLVPFGKACPQLLQSVVATDFSANELPHLPQKELFS